MSGDLHDDLDGIRRLLATEKSSPPMQVAGYRILGEVARGGMGVVYKARQESLGRTVALKVRKLGQPGDTDRQWQERFRREAQAAASLQHPHIVRVYELGESEGLLYMTMDFVEGLSLDKIIRAGEIDVPRAVSLAAQVADALAHAHGRGVLHRDVKPSNILVDERGDARLTDFGLARSASAAQKLTVTGTVLGTYGYMSPEQMQGELDKLDARTDVFGLGATLYEMLAGRAPFAAPNQNAVIAKVLAGKPEPPASSNPKVPAALSSLVLSCLARKREDRHPDCASLAGALRKFAGDPRPDPASSRKQAVPLVPGFEIQREISRGGMGVVYLARQTSLGRDVALKVLREGTDASQKAIERFAAEARAAGSLSHPNIVPIHDMGRAGDLWYFTMDYIPGKALSDYIRDPGVSPMRAVELAAGVARALDYLHGRGLLHRDLKPQNVLIDEAGAPRLADFGLAKDMSQAASSRTAEILGTPNYLPPELARGESAEVDRRTDIYGLGAILYEMLTGRPPFEGEFYAEVIAHILTDPVRKPREIKPYLDPKIEAVCLKALAREKADRYQTAGEFLAHLEAVRQGRSVQMAIEVTELGERRRAAPVQTPGVPREPRPTPARSAPVPRPARPQAPTGPAPGPAARPSSGQVSPPRLQDALPWDETPSAPWRPALWIGVGLGGVALLAGLLFLAFGTGGGEESDADTSGGAEAPPPATGRLAVRSVPPGATVAVDGVERGRTPLLIPDIAVGPHRLVVSRRKYGTADETVEVKKGKIEREFVLAPPGMVLVPSGSYTTGIPRTVIDRYEGEGIFAASMIEELKKFSVRKVELPGFFIDVYEVSNAEYREFIDATNHPAPPGWTGRAIPEGEADCAVAGLVYGDALAYCDWKGRRLPTAAEWEKAARGEDGLLYPWGTDFDPQKTNTKEARLGVVVSRQHPLVQRDRSPFGVYAMCGNVYEWTSTPSPEEESVRYTCGLAFATIHNMDGAYFPIFSQPCWQVGEEVMDTPPYSRGFRTALSLDEN